MQVEKDWEKYINGFKVFLEATERVSHRDPEVADMPYDGCRDAKTQLILVGVIEVKMLFDQVGKVAETYNWEEVLEKVSSGISNQIDQLEQSRGKLDTMIPNLGRLGCTKTATDEGRNWIKQRKARAHNTCTDRPT